MLFSLRAVSLQRQGIHIDWDNITQYKYFDEKRILFKENSDTLYLYDGKNTIKIDDKVQNLYFPEKESYWDEDFFELYTLKAHF